MVELEREPLVEVSCPYCGLQQVTPYTLREIKTLKEGRVSTKIRDNCGGCGQPFYYRAGRFDRIVTQAISS